MAGTDNGALNAKIIDSVIELNEYTTEQITRLLKTKNDEYRIVHNEAGSSQVWKSFGLPAKMNEFGHLKIISGFASCKECQLTYLFDSSKIGTTPLQRHICANKKKDSNTTTKSKTRSLSCSSSTSSSVIKINNTDTLFSFGIQKQITGTTKEVDTLKVLMVQWICSSLRPVSVVEDQGLINLLQAAVNLGSKYNSFDITCLLRKRLTITNEISTIAKQHREILKEQLAEPYLNRSLTLTPDIWKEKHNSLSFLGCSVSLVDNNFQFITFDLFCKEFEEPNQRFMSIINEMQNALEEFGIKLHLFANVVCDRGSNIIKALQQSHIEPIHCLAHRMNNILNKCFLTNDKSTKSIQQSITQVAQEQNLLLSSEDESSCHSSDDERVPVKNYSVVSKAQKSKKKHIKIKRNQIGNDDINHSEVKTLNDLPAEALSMVQTIKYIKAVVKYVKKANINSDIRKISNATLKQCTKVRWLSLYSTIESFNQCYEAVKIVLKTRPHAAVVNNLFNKISKDAIQDLLKLLLPFKVLTELIQISQRPSLHLGVLSLLKLKQVYLSAKKLDCFYRDQLERNTSKKETNRQHQNHMVDISRDKEEEQLDGESSDNEDDDEYVFESQGLTYLRQRLLYLLENMFDLDDRHYAAVFLHPRYYSAMEYWTREEKQSTNRFIKKQLQVIEDETKLSSPQCTDNDSNITTPKRKRQRTHDIFSEYSSSTTEAHGKKKNYGSENEDNNQYDELLSYKTLMLKEKGSKQEENPLLWWKSNETTFPMLSLLARRIFSMPITSASVERQFSQAGLVYSDRRTRIKPSLLNDILLVRSKYKIGLNDV